MVKGVEDQVYKNLQTQFLGVCPGYLKTMQRENEVMQSRDVFLSHASEDKNAIARPLADALIGAGYSVWFDEYEIKIGDSLRKKIDEGLASSRFGLVILSPSFFGEKKTWTKRELDGLTALEDVSSSSQILPVWHNISHAEVTAMSPTLGGVKALVAKGITVDEMAKELGKVLKA